MTYVDFKILLQDCLYKTTGKFGDSQTTCSVHFKKMFECLDIREAFVLLIQAEEHKEFHPDQINNFKAILNKRNTRELKC